MNLVMRLSLPHSLSFPKKMRLAGFVGFTFLCFLGWSGLAFRSDCEFTCDAASCSLRPKIFPRKTRLAGGIPLGSHCHCKFSFVPKPGRKPNLDKGTFYRRCWVIGVSVPPEPRVALVRKGIGHGTHNSSKRMSHQKVGMSKVAYHRMLVGGLDVVKRANAETR